MDPEVIEELAEDAPDEEIVEEVAEEEGAEDEPSEEAEIEITIGDDPAPEPEVAAPDWVKDLRKRNAEQRKRIRELEEAAKVAPAVADKATALGEKPTLEGCNFEADKFESALDEWKERKAGIEKRRQEQADAESKGKAAWQATLDGYETARKALKVRDFDEMHEVVKETLSVIQQGIILQGTRNSAQVVYALGKSPKRLQELAAIQDPVKFAIAIGEAQALMKVAPKKTAPAPEGTIKGGAAGAGTGGVKLKQLEEQAQKTGDYTAYFKAKRAAKK